MADKFHVAIIGGGLSGCLLANGLLQHSIKFDLYEADSINTKRAGYQIRLGSNALIGFKSCLTDAQRERLYPLFGRSGGVLASAPTLYTHELKQVLDLAKFPAHAKSAPINRVILRNFLSEPLQKAGRIHYSKEFRGYRIISRSGHADRLEIEFEDGTKAKCDMLISAEGSVSRVNKIIGLNNIVQHRDHYSFLAKGSLPPSKLDTLPSEVQKGAIAISSRNITLFYSAYLPDGMEKARAKVCPIENKKFDYDTSIASIFWALSIPAEQVRNQDILEVKDKLGFCIDQIKDWDSRVQQMLRAIENDDIHVLQPRSSKKPRKDWRRNVADVNDSRKGNNHVWLLGDAIHPMFPSRGMGGNQALRDCADILPAILSLAQKAGISTLLERDFDDAVIKYEKRMIPRAFKWVQLSDSTQRNIPDVSTFRGRLRIFFMARLLDVIYLVYLITKLVGVAAKDDAPELPN